MQSYKHSDAKWAREYEVYLHLTLGDLGRLGETRETEGDGGGLGEGSVRFGDGHRELGRVDHI